MFRPHLHKFIDAYELPGQYKNEICYKTDCCNVVSDFFIRCLKRNLEAIPVGYRRCGLAYINTQNTSISPVVLSFQVVFVNKFSLIEDIVLPLVWT